MYFVIENLLSNKRLSRFLTLLPSDINFSVITDPIYPAPPISKIFFHNCFNSISYFYEKTN